LGSLFHPESQGWLEARGFIDFAGSTVVHSVGAWVALAAIMVVGPRRGRFTPEGKPVKMRADNIPLAYLGTIILFFGWFGFNCGSTLEATSDIGVIAANTLVAACFAAVRATLVTWIRSGSKKSVDPLMVANGMLGGLVAITAGCAVVDTYGAILLGLVAGVVDYYGTMFLERTLKLDDGVGAIPIHGFCGVVGRWDWRFASPRRISRPLK
jgi:Amt family ammonium transporter